MVISITQLFLTKCDLQIAIVALFVMRGCRLCYPPFALQIIFFVPFRPAQCHLSFSLTGLKRKLPRFSSKNNSSIRNFKQKRNLIFLNCSRQPCLFTTCTRMPSGAVLRVFSVGKLLACILVSILRTVKKTLSSLLTAFRLVGVWSKHLRIFFGSLRQCLVILGYL